MDMDNLYGAYHFLEETKAAGIQGLLGLDLNLVKDGQPLSLRLLAINSQGYRNLMKVSILIMLEPFLGSFYCLGLTPLNYHLFDAEFLFCHPNKTRFGLFFVLSPYHTN